MNKKYKLKNRRNHSDFIYSDNMKSWMMTKKFLEAYYPKDNNNPSLIDFLDTKDKDELLNKLEYSWNLQ